MRVAASHVGNPTRLAEGVVRFVPVFPPGKAYLASQPGLGRFRLKQEIHIIESSLL